MTKLPPEIYGICGPSCETCPAYKATRSGRVELERIATQWTESMNRQFFADDIICDGCRVENGRRSAYCSGCEIRNCAQSKGSDTCAHCEKCPCEKIVAPPAIDALAELRRMMAS